MRSTHEDEIADQLTAVFSSALQLLRERNLGREMSLETEAMDLLMDHALLLGPENLANVLTILAVEQEEEAPVTRAQANFALNCWFEAGRLLGASS